MQTSPSSSEPAVAWRLPRMPFFDERHQRVNDEVRQWIASEPGIHTPVESGDFAAIASSLVSSMGRAGLLRHVVAREEDTALPDVRTICLIRDQLGYYSALADVAFAMQGIGTLPVWHFGTAQQKHKYLGGNRDGSRVAALALSEPTGGSDVASTRTSAAREGDGFVINGTKTWISNGGAASQYIVVARTGEGAGSKGLSAFIVDADNPGLHVSAQINTMAPHALATLEFKDCRVDSGAMLGGPGEGFKIAMSTLDVFRTSVGAFALGLARRAFDEALSFVARRSLFGAPMGELDGVQSRIGEMKMDLEAATLLVYHAAWLKDTQGSRITTEASMAKCHASERAFAVIDAAMQLMGAMGLTRGVTVERLFRDIRPARIFEGASEVQKLIIGRNVIREWAGSMPGTRS